MFESTIRALRSSLSTQKVQTILQQKPDALMVYDMSQIDAAYALFSEHLPNVRPYYAVKCNPTPEIVRRLAGLGAGFDCASKAELDLVSSVAPSSDIAYAHPVKSSDGIARARDLSPRVRWTTVDSEHELIKLKDEWPDADILVRIRVDDGASHRPLGRKFGAEMDDVPRLLKDAQSLGLSVVGVAFHVGSGCSNPMAYYRAIELAHHVFEVASSQFGIKMRVLDIGGGFTASDDGDFFATCARAIQCALHRYFDGTPNLEVIAEPGRFFVEACGRLYVKVIGKRQRPNVPIEYFVADGKYGHFGLLYANGTAPRPRTTRSGMAVPSRVYGPTCDAEDIVLDDAMLPQLHVGDFLEFERMGAYTVCAATTFNGFDVRTTGKVVCL